PNFPLFRNTASGGDRSVVLWLQCFFDLLIGFFPWRELGRPALSAEASFFAGTCDAESGQGFRLSGLKLVFAQAFTLACQPDTEIAIFGVGCRDVGVAKFF